MAKTSSRAVWAIAIILVVIILDQLTKHLILRAEVFNAYECLNRTGYCGRVELNSVFDLSMVWNRGFSFGLAQSEGIWRWVLFLVQLSVGGLFFYWLMSARHRLTALSLALVVGGAVGNLIDRFRFGAVVDFFDFSGPWFGIEIPLAEWLYWLEPIFNHGEPDRHLGLGFPYVFNIADAAITVGAICLLIDQFLLNRHDAGAGPSENKR